MIDRVHIFVSQYALETEWVPPEEQILYGKGMSQDMRTHSLGCDPGSLSQPLEELLYSILGQGPTRLRQEQMLLSGTATPCQFLLIRSMLIQVREHMFLAVLS
jgi:hypothetical protein